MIGTKVKLALAAMGMTMMSAQSMAVFTINPTTYAVEQVASNSTVLQGSVLSYTVDTASIGAGGSLTFTLTGASVSGSWPALTCSQQTNECGTVTTINPSQTSATSATYQIPSAVLVGAVFSNGNTPLSLTNAITALGSPAVCTTPPANRVQVSVVGVTGSPNFNPTVPATASLAYSCNTSAVTVAGVGQGNAAEISITNGALSFTAGSAAANNSTIANIGYFSTAVNPVKLADGTTQVGGGVVTGSSLTITGNFNGIGSVLVKAANNGNNCDLSEQTIATATPTASVATFGSFASVATTRYCLFVQANQATPMATSQYYVQSGSTSYAAGYSAETTPWAPGQLTLISLDGETASVKYVVGQGPYYNNFVAVTNNTNLAQPLYVYTVSYGLNGNPAGVVYGGLYGNIPASGGVLLSSSDIAAATDGVLPSNDAAQVYFYSPGDLSATNMLLNTTGNIVTGIQ